MLELSKYIIKHGVDKTVGNFGLMANVHPDYPNLYLFKYRLVDCDFSNIEVRQSRGIILDSHNDWKPVCYTYNKFYNYGSGYCGGFDWGSASVYEKLDGSLIQMYWYDDMWHVASSGVPDASGRFIDGDTRTFAQLFWEVWNELEYTLPRHNDCCYAFELCTNFNRVIVNHEKSRIILHGIRNMETLKENHIEFDGIIQHWEYAHDYKIQNPDVIVGLCKSINPTKNEGFVAIDKNFNRIKFKSPQYVAISHLNLGEKWLMRIIQTNEMDEYLNYFPQYKSEYEVLKKKYNAIANDILLTYNMYKDIEDKKGYAMKVKGHPCSGILFLLKSKKIDSVKDGLSKMDSQKLLEMLK